MKPPGPMPGGVGFTTTNQIAISTSAMAGASVERIAEEAGYTRGAFYSNFATREELFAELLQQRVYARYADMAEREVPASMREVGEALARIQGDDDRGHWLFRLWLELLAHAGRDERFREIAIGLALQHFVDPEAAPLDLYPELFGRLGPGR